MKINKASAVIGSDEVIEVTFPESNVTTGLLIHDGDQFCYQQREDFSNLKSFQLRLIADKLDELNGVIV